MNAFIFISAAYNLKKPYCTRKWILNNAIGIQCSTKLIVYMQFYKSVRSICYLHQSDDTKKLNFQKYALESSFSFQVLQCQSDYSNKFQIAVLRSSLLCVIVIPIDLISISFNNSGAYYVPIVWYNGTNY